MRGRIVVAVAFAVAITAGAYVLLLRPSPALHVRNATGSSLVVALDDGRVLELPPGARVGLDRAAQARALRAGTAPGAWAYARAVSPGDEVILDPRQLGLDALPAAAPAAPGTNLTAGRPALADETDASTTPAAALDGNPRTFWRPLIPPPSLASWSTSWDAPVTVARVQVRFECLTCGRIALRIAFLSAPLPPATFAAPSEVQTTSIRTLLDTHPEIVAADRQVAGAVDDGAALDLVLPSPVGGVRALVITIVEAPENVGLREVVVSPP